MTRISVYMPRHMKIQKTYIHKAILLISLLCSAQLLTAQTKINITLKAQLDSIYAMDQVLRMYFTGELTPANS